MNNRSAGTLLICVLVSAGCTSVRGPSATASDDLPGRVVPGAQWRAEPPLGYAADAGRRNLPVGGSYTFRDLVVRVVATRLASAETGQPVDAVDLQLTRDGTSASRTANEGDAFVWSGYRIAVVAIAGPGELGAGLVSLEVATLESVPAGIAAAATAGDAAMRARVPHSITHITLHHTGSAEPLRREQDPVQLLRALQAWGAAERNWWDVPYHYLIDLDGNIYEGRDWRYSGETNTAYNPGGHFLISVIGNYELQEPTPSQIDAIADMMAWAVRRFEIPLDRIGGHYDHAETLCPGEHLRARLEDGTFQRMVEARLALRA